MTLSHFASKGSVRMAVLGIGFRFSNHAQPFHVKGDKIVKIEGTVPEQEEALACIVAELFEFQGGNFPKEICPPCCFAVAVSYRDNAAGRCVTIFLPPGLGLRFISSLSLFLTPRL